MSMPPSTIRMVLPCPRPKRGKTWGDWFFAKSLAAGFGRLGVATQYVFTSPYRVKPAVEWLTARGQIDLVIRGARPFARLRNRPYFMWLISHPDTVTDAELRGAEHVFVASMPFCADLSARGVACSFLPQCTDGHLFKPREPDASIASDVLFVGNKRSYAARPVVDLALRENLDLHVWGRGWQKKLPEGVLKGQSIENAQLGRYYSAANIVLNDHTETMLQAGFASNRIYDVLASGTALLTEQMDGLPDVVAMFGHQYTAPSFPDAIERARVMSADQKQEASRAVLAEHTFDNRAQAILKVMQQ